jgi:hypothetical protein
VVSPENPPLLACGGSTLRGEGELPLGTSTLRGAGTVLRGDSELGMFPDGRPEPPSKDADGGCGTLLRDIAVPDGRAAEPDTVGREVSGFDISGRDIPELFCGRELIAGLFIGR